MQQQREAVWATLHHVSAREGSLTLDATTQATTPACTTLARRAGIRENSLWRHACGCCNTIHKQNYTCPGAGLPGTVQQQVSVQKLSGCSHMFELLRPPLPQESSHVCPKRAGIREHSQCERNHE